MQLNSASHLPIGHSNIIFSTALIILTTSSIVLSTAIPPPTGPYQVGKRKYTMEHYNDHDPLAPNNVSTAFLATVYYPTAQKPEEPPRPYLEPETAAYFETSWFYPTGLLASLTSSIQPDAPFLNSDGLPYPTILFGPGGGGPPVEGNTILLSELASYGYAVIGIDHPFEQPFIRYPNGTGVVGVDLDNYPDSVGPLIYDIRLENNAVFLDKHLSKLVNEFKLPFNTTHIGALGFSLGGAAALESAQRNKRLVSGLNLDGTMNGAPALTSSAADVKKPVFLLGHEGHDGVGGDYTWGSFPLWQTAYQRKMLINGTTHLDFCDNTFWKTLVNGTGPSSGPIDGREQVRVLNAYVRAFFNLTLLGRNSPILDRPSPEFPEVVYYNVSGRL